MSRNERTTHARLLLLVRCRGCVCAAPRVSGPAALRSPPRLPPPCQPGSPPRAISPSETPLPGAGRSPSATCRPRRSAADSRCTPHPSPLLTHTHRHSLAQALGAGLPRRAARVARPRLPAARLRRRLPGGRLVAQQGGGAALEQRQLERQVFRRLRPWRCVRRVCVRSRYKRLESSALLPMRLTPWLSGSHGVGGIHPN